jgi:hypothetical protein
MEEMKMKTLMLSASVVLATAMPGFAPPALADTIQLYNWGFNVDGTLIDKANTPGPLPPSVNGVGFNFATGLGTLTVTAAGAGMHSIDIFFDHDMNPPQFAADHSAAVGAPAAGESWEIGTGAKGGETQLFLAFTANNYDDVNHSPGPDDVAMGLAFTFTNTPAGPLGIVTVNVGTTAPSSGFYLHQFNTTAGTSPTDIYFSATLANSATPEPATWLLFLAPLSGLIWRLRKAPALCNSL